MNDGDRIIETARAVTREVVRLVGTDPALKAAVRTLAEALLAAAGDGETATAATPVESTGRSEPQPTNGVPRPATSLLAPVQQPAATVSAEPEEVPEPDDTPITELASRLTLGRGTAEPEAEAAWRSESDYPPPLALDDLAAIAGRCRVKARASRGVAEAVRAGLAADDGPGVAELRNAAGPDCPLWMLYLSGDRYAPTNEGSFLRLGDSFDAVAEACDLLHEVWSDDATSPATRSEALQLGASAQSALRRAAGGFQDFPDRDQVLAFIWMRDTGRNERIYIRNHFRQGDLASPAICPGLRGEIARLHEALSSKRTTERKREKLFDKLRYLRRKIAEDDEGGADHHWDRYAEIVAELAGLGVAANAAKYRELAPPRETWPPEPPEPLAAVLQEVAADADRRTTSEAASAEAGGYAGLSEVIADAEREFGDALVFALNGRSEVKGNPFGDPPAFYRALRFLATTYRDARSGRRPEPRLNHRCREETGFDYSANQSDTTVGMFRDYYETTYRGRKVALHSHLSKGQNHDPRHTLRIAFHWDEEVGRVVVGYVGQHQKTRAT